MNQRYTVTVRSRQRLQTDHPGKIYRHDCMPHAKSRDVPGCHSHTQCTACRLGVVDTVDSIQLPDDRLGRTHHVREQYDVASRFVMHRLDYHAINTWLAVASQEAGDMYCQVLPLRTREHRGSDDVVSISKEFTPHTLGENASGQRSSSRTSPFDYLSQLGHLLLDSVLFYPRSA